MEVGSPKQKRPFILEDNNGAHQRTIDLLRMLDYKTRSSIPSMVFEGCTVCCTVCF